MRGLFKVRPRGGLGPSAGTPLQEECEVNATLMVKLVRPTERGGGGLQFQLLVFLLCFVFLWKLTFLYVHYGDSHEREPSFTRDFAN